MCLQASLGLSNMAAALTSDLKANEAPVVLPTFQPVALPQGVWILHSPAADVVVGEAVTTHQDLLLLRPQ